jgi:hypothetical protein
MKAPGLIAWTVLGLSVASTVLACGDKLSAIAGGVRFERVYAARHPGRVAIYAPAGSALQAANSDLRLAETLRHAGHTVTVFEHPQDLRRALQLSTADLVLVDVADSRQLQAEESGAAAGAAYVVVGYAPKDKAAHKVLSQSKCVTALTRRTGPLLLRELDTVLERRSRGLPGECAAGAAALST